MRVIVFFDLPSVTSAERKQYRLFRRFLLNEGFIMMQESVYSKLLLNSTNVNLLKIRLKKNLPKEGLIQVLTVTEKQYADIECILGDASANTNTLNTSDRLVIY